MENVNDIRNCQHISLGSKILRNKFSRLISVHISQAYFRHKSISIHWQTAPPKRKKKKNKNLYVYAYALEVCGASYREEKGSALCVL